MTDTEALLRELQASGGGEVCRGRQLDALDLRGRVLDVPLNLTGALIAGPVDLSQAELRGGLLATRARFEGGLSARRCLVTGDVQLSHAQFMGPVDLSYSHVRGRVYAWRARFHRDATFRQLMVAPGTGIDRSFVWPGEVNFSWSWFHGETRFERCSLDGPVYFWRSRFLDRCSFNETSFGSDATFMGLPSEVCLARDELGWELFDRLEEQGLIRRDDEELAVVDGRELPMFGQLSNVRSTQELEARLVDAALSVPERLALLDMYRQHSGPMFAQAATLQRLRIVQPRKLKFIAVHSKRWDLSGTDVNAIGFYNAAEQQVPVNVGLGKPYQRVFISFGGPDRAVAERFNRAFQDVGVDTYYYPEDSLPGRLIDREMNDGVTGFDRVFLICSRTSPERPGWQFELRRALEREARQGTGTVLIAAAIDDGLWTPWPDIVEPMRRRLLERTVADFRDAMDDSSAFQEQLGLVLAALTRPPEPDQDPPGSS